MLRKFCGLCLILLPLSLFADLDTDTLGYINKFRTAHGLSKLVVDKRICEVAKKHSLNMARHVVPVGHDGFSRRIQELHKLFPNYTGGAENVAYNYKTAAIVADGWIHSPGHRQNILGNYNLTCIATARDAEGKLYYTQMFIHG